MSYRFVQFLGLMLGPLSLVSVAERSPDLGTYNSLGDAIKTAMYGVRPDRAGFAAPNPRHHFSARFSGDGLRLTGAGWESSWRLRSIGYGGRQTAVAPAQLRARGSRMELRRGAGVMEWYVNGVQGLEQGFTLQRPAGERRAGEKLQLTIQIKGNLLARDAINGVELVKADGSVALQYEHLIVKDAKGKKLAASMSVVEDTVRLEVEDAGAAWPITVDPVFVQQAYIKASNTGAIDLFGISVGISGRTVVVGASQESSAATGVGGDQTDESAPDAGAAYVFTRTGTAWTQEAYLKASDTRAGALFGVSVGISGDTIVIGSHAETAYVFTRTATTWTQQAVLKASNTNPIDAFGAAVAISGNTIVVGAHLEDSSASGVNGNQVDNSVLDSGAAYVFVRDGNTWPQQAYLKASNPERGDHFGFSVAISVDTVVIGADQEGSSATGVNGDQTNNNALLSGAAYVFARTGTAWTQQAYLKASNTDPGDAFGQAVAISGETLVVGAFRESSNATGVNGNERDNSASGSGAAYVFSRHGFDWQQQAYLKAPNPDVDDNFGKAVAIDGDGILVGAQGEDSRARGVNGDPTNNGSPLSGAAYFFIRDLGAWSFRDYIKPSNNGDNLFGASVSISGNTIVVGAFAESSNATGIDGDQNNLFAPVSGAAYAFLDDSLCSIRLSHLSEAIGPGGGPSAVGVVASVACTWTAVSNVDWITITSAPSGTGTGTVLFSVAPSPGGIQRSGTLTIAGQTFTVVQTDPNGCFYTLSPSTGLPVPAIGGTGVIEVIAPFGCPWTAVSNSSFLRITGPSTGAGGGLVQYSLLANPGTPRTGTITIAGQTFSVAQESGTSTPTPDNALTLSQVVGGGQEWHTTLFVTNLSNTSESFTIRFYDDSGSALAMPIESLGSVDTITDTLGPAQTRRYETGVAPSLLAGWAVLSPGSSGTSRLSGFAVFRHTVPADQSTFSSEAVVDFVGVRGSKYILLYDNLAGFTTTASLANPDVQNAVTLQAEIRDESGVLLATDSITLPPLGHTAFVLTQRFPATAGRRGSIRFVASPKSFTGMGLRFSPFGGFTSFRFLTSPDIQ